MTTIEADIVRAKENLRLALGERYLDYMQSMKKWFAGKTSKQEFDREAREIVTNNNATAPKTIFPFNSTSSFSTSFNNTPKKATKLKKKSKLSENSSTHKPTYHLRFVPVDPIKHAPSIITSSFETAFNLSESFCLEFCARERSLPYAKMIHGRMLVSAVDFSLQSVDIKAVFLLAEATIFMLKNIITKLVSRSKFKHEVRSKAVYDLYEKNCISDKKLLDLHQKRLNANKNNEFEIDSDLINILKNDNLEQSHQTKIESSYEIDDLESTKSKSKTDQNHFEVEENKSEIENISNVLTNPMSVPVRKLPINLFDLKNLLQIDKFLMPSHSVRTVFMERIIMNMFHDDDE